MSTPTDLLKKALENFDEIERTGTDAVERAQEENRRLSIPNACSRNSTPYFEPPNGTITQEEPFVAEDEE